MTTRFEAVSFQHPQRFDDVSRNSARSPFNTLQYADAASRIGLQPYCFCIVDNDEIAGGCVALLMTQSWRRRLEIPSIPKLDGADTFWEGVEQFCLRQKVIDLHINSFASKEVSLPHFAHQLSSRKRCEYVLDLGIDLEAALSRNHRRNIRKARKAGLRIMTTRSPEACSEHLRLMKKSANRRTARGEQVDMPDDSTLHAALLMSGSGVLFQACQNDDVFSSILILKGADAAYYHSAGTSPAGMKSGASQYLISEVSKILQQEGLRELNLSGAETDGLRAFKIGFGSTEVPLAAASYSMVSPMLRKMRRLSYLAKRTPAKFVDLLRR